ncbi:MAG TPA: tetratricopeptide repeat protein, partial [Pyrinomonadaceae bacterium]|nr:tetratricopeptide repeat protein [Pyrinomonadaceae bacterium]
NRPVDFAGYFQSGLDVNYVALPVEGRARDAYAKIFHESVHLLIDSRARRMPDWLNEGLALYYSTFEFSDADGKAVIGRPIAEYLRTLRTRNLLPLATLFAIERDSADYNEADKSGIFYAESWALVHYLISGHGGRRQLQILRFLELCAAGVPVEEGFRKGFGVDYAGMERELAAYLAQEITGVKYTDAARPAALDADWQTALLTEAEAEYYQGDLLLHIDRLEDATRHLRRALELDERLAPAHAAFGVAAARQRMFRDAVSHLRRAVALQPDSYLAHYYYAYALSRQGMDEAQAVNAYAPEAATVMRAELNRAIELAPAFPESYRLLAFVNLVTGEQLDEAAALLRRALVLAPNRPDISYILAEVYVRKGDWAEARDALRRVFRSGAPARLRARANTLLARIDAEERAPVKH